MTINQTPIHSTPEPRTLDQGFATAQALADSRPYAETFRKQHAANSVFLNAEEIDLLAIARYQLALGEAQRELRGRFDNDDISMMMGVLMQDFVSPDRLKYFASTVCEGFGVEVDEYHHSPIAELVEKLLALTSFQTLALVDALEHAWHVGMKDADGGLTEVFAKLGMDLQ